MSEIATSSILIQPFFGTDAETQGVAKLVLSIQRDEFEIPITFEDQPDLQDIKRFFQFGNGNFWLALDVSKQPASQTVVGTTGLLDIGMAPPSYAKCLWMPPIVVSPTVSPSTCWIPS